MTVKSWVVFLLVVLYLVGFWSLGSGVWGVWQATQPAAWPTAPAKIRHAQLVVGSDAEGDTLYRVEVAYTYVVGGVEYEGSRVAFGYSGGYTREGHDALFQKIRDAKTIAARYDPANPAESCLSHGVHSSVGFNLWFAGGWLVLTAGVTALMFLFSRRDAALIDNIAVE